jgi:small GTP-binding protein
MGNIFDKIRGYFSKRECKILIFGLDAAGKTTILYQQKLNELIVSAPTTGFNVEMIEFNNARLTVWDINSGNRWIRSLLHHYYPGTDAIIYVVDSSDIERMD